MKALAKVLADFVTWRWAPTVALVSAAVLFVLFVVGVIPSEIEVPMANPRFSAKTVSTVAAVSTETAPEPVQPASLPPTPIAPARMRAIDFGRRGFSPPLERPEVPTPAPPPPPAPEPPPVAVVDSPPPPAAVSPMRTLPGLAGRMNGLLQSVSRVIPGAEPPAQPPAQPTEPPAGAQPPAPAAPPEGAPADGGGPTPDNPSGVPSPAAPNQP